MKRKLIMSAIAVAIIVVMVLGVFLGNILFTNLIDYSNVVLKDQKFTSAEEAIGALEAYEREESDTSLDYCPPYEVVYSFEYEDNTIVFYSFCDNFDGTKEEYYAIRILKHNDDNTLSFDGGFAYFCLKEHEENGNYYYFTNINTSQGKKSISFLYLDKQSDKDIYVDGIKATKDLVTIDGKVFYLCYAISSPDTFLSNLFTSVGSRHNVEIK